MEKKSVDEILFDVIREASEEAIHSVAKLYYNSDKDAKRVMCPFDGVFHNTDLILLKAVWREKLNGEFTKFLYKEKVLGMIRQLLAIKYYIETMKAKN